MGIIDRKAAATHLIHNQLTQGMNSLVPRLEHFISFRSSLEAFDSLDSEVDERKESSEKAIRFITSTCSRKIMWRPLDCWIASYFIK